MSIEVQSAQSEHDLREFQRFPRTVYRNVSQWVPPLLAEERKLLDPARRHPFHAHADVALFLVRRDGKVAARIAACVNHLHNETQKDKVGFFGFFEALDDPRASEAALKAACDWLQERGMKSARGPASYSLNDTCGILTEGFETTPAILMPYNPDYYATHLKSAGFAACKEMVAYRVDRSSEMPARLLKRLERVHERLKSRGKITLRDLGLKNLESENEGLRKIYNSAWKDHWGFVPMTKPEFANALKDFRAILDNPHIAVIAEIEGEPVGFSLTVPDLNPSLQAANGHLFPWGILKFLWVRRKRRGLRTVALGVKPEHRKKGIDGLLIQETVKRGLAQGYQWCEMGWVLEENLLMRKLIEAVGGEVTGRYAMFEKSLPGALIAHQKPAVE